MSKKKIEETFHLADSFDEEIIDERAQTIESCKEGEIELKIYQKLFFKHNGKILSETI